MPNKQLSQYPNKVLWLIAELQHQQYKLDSLILKTPTSNVRNDLTAANIHLMAAISDLKNIV